MDNKVSIIIPVFNIENYIEKCIQSVCAQTYTNIEIIVIDDGSKDSTGKVADLYANSDDRIKVYHKENEGVSAARLYGLKHATGQFVGFVDGDDYIDEDMVERLVNNIYKYKADISHCGYQRNYPDGRIDKVYGTGQIKLQNNMTGLKDLLLGTIIEPGLCNKLFKKELFSNHIDTFVNSEKIKINEDLLMNYYLFKEARTSIFEDFCPYHYVFRKNSASKSKLNEYSLKDPMRVLKIIDDDINNQLTNVLNNRIVRQMIAVSTMSGKENPDLVIPYRKLIRRELRKNIGYILYKSGCENKLKIIALWSAIWPFSYGVIHRMYEKTTGLDKKFSVD